MTQANHLPDTVEEMLLDAGQARSDELRAALLALGSLALLPAPAPSGELAALLAASDGKPGGGVDGAGATADSGSEDESTKRRRLRAHRPTVVGLALIAGMGLGVGGVAASSPVPGHSGARSVQHLLEDWAPAWSLPVPGALGSMLPEGPNGLKGLNGLNGLDGLGGHAEVETATGEPVAGVSTDNANGGTSPAPLAAEDPSVPPSAGEAPVVPPFNPPGPGTQGNAEAHDGGGQGAATDQRKSDASAAARENHGTAAGLPEQAAGRDAGAPVAGGQGGADHQGGAGLGAHVDSVPGALRQGAEAAGAAVKAVPGTKWLQKFSR
ncbi:hypothetical protein ACFVYC_16455 [Pseudarthrobacter sp. NPDC058329]|uniref:hypothetical protein n=1 Tax=Pseudarthrobacter sp. NPDC058329 TaxID=3346448 RepID=UPI0036D7CDBB